MLLYDPQKDKTDLIQSVSQQFESGVTISVNRATSRSGQVLTWVNYTTTKQQELKNWDNLFMVKHGFDPAEFTEQGCKDYEKACAEVEATRGLAKSPYANVYRLHCTNGYVDFNRTTSVPTADQIVAEQFGVPTSEVNGLVTSFSVDTLLVWLRSSQICIYDTYRTQE